MKCTNCKGNGCVTDDTEQPYIDWKDIMRIKWIIDCIDVESHTKKLPFDMMTKDYYEEILRRFNDKNIKYGRED